jgi:ribosomal protein S27AE
MVTPPNDTLMSGMWPSLDANRSPFSDQPQVARRSSSRQCPDCGSITVRSRDKREMCLICGYLQSQA